MSSSFGPCPSCGEEEEDPEMVIQCTCGAVLGKRTLSALIRSLSLSGPSYELAERVQINLEELRKAVEDGKRVQKDIQRRIAAMRLGVKRTM